VGAAAGRAYFDHDSVTHVGFDGSWPGGLRHSDMHNDMHKRGQNAVSRIFASWNQLDRWLRQVEGLRRVA